jgi:hypothetical protein
VVAVVVLAAACSGGTSGDGGAGADGDRPGTTGPEADAALPDAVLPESFPAFEGPDCTDDPERGTVRVTPDCVDPELRQPYVDIDEEREATDPDAGVTVRYRYVHGGFEGTEARFSLYFPPTDAYEGRFFHYTYPTIADEDAAEVTIAFSVSHGAYAVSTNNAGGVAASPSLGGYRVNAAAARFSRVVAAALYGEDAAARGYLYGASGGAYQTIGGLESTEGIWDGGVPMVPGTSNAIPSFQGAQLLGLRVLGEDLAGVVDALEPGGSGDPAAGLDVEQRAVLDEVTALGFPVRGWWQHEALDGGSFYAVAAGVRTLDAAYVDDFWSVPGYEGADPASSVRRARVQIETTVTAVDGDPATAVTLAEVPASADALRGADLVVLDGDAAGSHATIGAVDGDRVELRPESDPAAVAALGEGARVRVDNSWALALQYYHRHQVPDANQPGWDQFRDDGGRPIPPQRTTLVGNVLAGTSGGVATGRFHGRMIMLASTMDVEAFPWSADWYHRIAEDAAGGDLDDSYRLWFMENADHTPPKDTAAGAHIVAYTGEMQQALLDLDAWVADDLAPPPTSTYDVSDDNQVTLPDEAHRGGLQPVVGLIAAAHDDCDEADGAPEGDGGDSVEVAAGDPVSLHVKASVPPDAGEVVRIEWDDSGGGDFDDEAAPDELAAEATACRTHTYDEPGTYFAVARVTAQRTGDTDTPYGLVQNLARVRVTVT